MFLDLARKRYSLRSFLNKEIEREKLEYVVEAARYAPSACNLQPVKFYVVTDKDMLSKIHHLSQGMVQESSLCDCGGGRQTKLLEKGGWKRPCGCRCSN